MPIEPQQFGPDLAELAEKEKRVRTMLAERELDAIVLTRLCNFSWLTGGRDCSIFLSGDRGEAALLITPTHKYVIVPNVEVARLTEEEGLATQGFEFAVQSWWESGHDLARLVQNRHWGADWEFPGAVDLSDVIAHLRFQLTPAELERFRWLGRASAGVLESTARALRPSMSEHEIAARLAQESLARGISPMLILVGTDERVFRYRHPIPTCKKLEQYAMLVLCGRRWGLVASATRLVHFGALPPELERKAHAVAQVDATYITATRVGARIADIFQRGVQAYADVGFPDEWQKHYQGGAAGYESREFEASPMSTEVVQENQAYAWNPSITGTKSEDTFLLTQDGREFITMTGEWPEIMLAVNGETIARPAILQRS